MKWLLTHGLIVCAIERDRRVGAIGVRAFHAFSRAVD